MVPMQLFSSPMPRLVHRGLVVAPVLHELRRQLHGIPLHPVDAGAVPVPHRCQHVLQAVAELVEQGFHLEWIDGERGTVRRER